MEITLQNRQSATVETDDHKEPQAIVEPSAISEVSQFDSALTEQPSLPSAKSLLMFAIPTLLLATIGAVTVNIWLGMAILLGICLGTYASAATSDIRQRINGYTGDIDAESLVGRD